MKSELLKRIAALTPAQQARIELEVENSLNRFEDEAKFESQKSKEVEVERQEREEREGAANLTAINTAVQEIATRGHLDLTTTAGYNAAWERLRRERPELLPSRVASC